MRIKRLGKRILPIILAAVCTFALAVPALAAGSINVNAVGSIDVDIEAYATHQAVAGGSLNLYYIADVHVVSGEVVYRYVDDFSGCDEDLLAKNMITETPADTANAFVDYVEKNDIEPTDTQEIASSGEEVGKAKFEDLSVGLYLITQNEQAEGYNSINPFLVTIPIDEDGNGTWIYDVNASPKTSPVKRLCTVTIDVEDLFSHVHISGAEFTLQNSDGEYASVDEDGDVTWMVAFTSFRIMGSAVTFNDLEEGEYILTEVHSDSTHDTPGAAFLFIIDSDGVVTITSAPDYEGEILVEVTGEPGDEKIMIENVSYSDEEKGSTGGTGTGGTGDNGAGGTGSGSGGSGGTSKGGNTKTGDYNLYIYGVLIVGAAAVLVVALRRRSRQEAD